MIPGFIILTVSLFALWAVDRYALTHRIAMLTAEIEQRRKAQLDAEIGVRT